MPGPQPKLQLWGPKGAIEILHSKKIQEITDPAEKEAYILKAEEEYKEKFANPYNAAKYGFIDDVIEPRNTRFRIIRAFQTLATKKDVNPPKKHSNLPL